MCSKVDRCHSACSGIRQARQRLHVAGPTRPDSAAEDRYIYMHETRAPAAYVINKLIMHATVRLIW